MPRDLNLPAIKIIDDNTFRNRIVDLFKNKTHQQVNVWSMKIVMSVFDLIEFSSIEINLINEGIAINKKWRSDFVRTHDIRQVCFRIHVLAKSSNNDIKRLALRTIAQATSSAHMKEHAMVASDYHIKLINTFYENDFEKVISTRKMQLNWLENS